MRGRFEVPELERRYPCVTSDFALGALVSSFSALPGRYFPLSEFPSIDPDTKPNSVESFPSSGKACCASLSSPRNFFPLGPCIWRKAHSEHLSPRPLTKETVDKGSGEEGGTS